MKKYKLWFGSFVKKYKLWFGLFGCSSDGVLYTPSNRRLIKLPKSLAFKIHAALNKFSYIGEDNTRLL
jgi:hypothetical protein